MPEKFIFIVFKVLKMFCAPVFAYSGLNLANIGVFEAIVSSEKFYRPVNTPDIVVYVGGWKYYEQFFTYLREEKLKTQLN